MQNSSSSVPPAHVLRGRIKQPQVGDKVTLVIAGYGCAIGRLVIHLGIRIRLHACLSLPAAVDTIPSSKSMVTAERAAFTPRFAKNTMRPIDSERSFLER